MAFTGNFMCTSFKQEILVAEHNFTLTTGDLMHMSLYDNSATLTAASTAYTSSGELATAGNYVARGKALTNVTPVTSGVTAYTDFADPVWSTATFSAYGALVFNEDHASDASVIVLDFGGVKTATAGDFSVEFPDFDAANAIIRIAA
jgi:hypothetical protein